MENQLLLPDSLNTIQQTIEIVAPAQTKSWIEIVCMIATVTIALVNVSLVIYMFVKNRNRDVFSKEKSRKLNLLKTLVLDYCMHSFYDFYRDIDNEVENLKNKDIDNEIKKKINEKLLFYGKILEQKFTDLFIGINPNLHERIKQEIDNLLDGFTENIFDENINIYTQENFSRLITNRIIDSKTQIIKILFGYSGE